MNLHLPQTEEARAEAGLLMIVSDKPINFYCFYFKPRTEHHLRKITLMDQSSEVILEVSFLIDLKLIRKIVLQTGFIR